MGGRAVARAPKVYDPDGIWVDGDWAQPVIAALPGAFREELGWSGTVGRTCVSARTSPRNMTHSGIRAPRAGAYALQRFVKHRLGPALRWYSAGNVSPRREFLAPR